MNEYEQETLVTKQINVLDLIKTIGKKNKQLQAKLLQELERHVDKNSPEFEELRKFVLDEVNSYTRTIVREVFGDIEFMVK